MYAYVTNSRQGAHIKAIAFSRSTIMVQLDARVTSVQIIARFPAHMIIPEPPGWQSGCQASAGVSPVVSAQVMLTPGVSLGRWGDIAVNGKVIGFSGSAGERITDLECYSEAQRLRVGRVTSSALRTRQWQNRFQAPRSP